MADALEPHDIYADSATKPPLDEKFYALDADEKSFFKSCTGIEDDEALKQHIIAFQTKAYEVRHHPHSAPSYN